MRTGTFGRALALFALYVGAFILLVVIQFPTSGPFGLAAGGVSFRGVPGDGGEGLRSAELVAAGIRLEFSERSPLSYAASSGEARTAKPAGYETLERGFALSFDDGSKLIVSSDGDGRVEWSLQTGTPASKASLRYQLAKGTTTLPPSDAGEPRFSADGTVYHLGGTASSEVAGELALTVSRGRIRPVSAVPETADAQPPAVQFLAQTPMDPAAWARVLSSWQDRVWADVSGPRLDAATATWKAEDGIPSFDEPTFIVYEAEALYRGRRDAAAALVAAVRSRHLDRITWRSVPYAGRTAAAMTAYDETSLQDVKNAERLAQARSPELFRIDGVMSLLFDRAPYSLAQEAMAMARSHDFGQAGVADAVRLLRTYLDARSYLSDGENPFDRVPELVDRVIAPAVRKTDDGFFLQTAADGRCDTALGLTAGKALVELAAATRDAIYEGIGQSLVTGLLGLAASDGSLPASVTVRDTAAIPSATVLRAVDAYRLIVSNPNLPHAVSFYRTLGPGVWAWTCSPSFGLVGQEGQTTFAADFPVGSSHYVALYGVKPFKTIRLYGLDYNMDAGFEGYNASGYFYRRASNVLYLKLRHKAEQEKIELFY